MDPHARAVSVWYRTAELASRNQKDLTVEIIEAEIRSALLRVLERVKGVVEVHVNARRQSRQHTRTAKTERRCRT